MSTSTAIVFPGQGSQRMGMALDFYDQCSEARSIFEKASHTLSIDIRSICSEDDVRLGLTEFTQPCLLTAEIAMFESLRSNFNLTACCFGGHSLGEYAALVASNAISFEAALLLVSARAKIVQKNVAHEQGKMVALIMQDIPRAEIASLAAKFCVDVANDNSPDQIVVSGLSSNMDELCQSLNSTYSELKQIELCVSAPFHSRHIEPAEEKFADILAEHENDFDAANAKSVTSNFTGSFHSGKTADLLNSLTKQLSSTVRWRDNMAALLGRCNAIYELGPNRVLGNFFKSSGFQARSIIDLRTAGRVLKKEG